MKIVFPAIWIPLWGFGILTMFSGGLEVADAATKWLFLIAWVVGCVFIIGVVSG